MRAKAVGAWGKAHPERWEWSPGEQAEAHSLQCRPELGSEARCPEALRANKVLLEHSYAHLFIHCLWLLLCCNSRVE